jgi:hypothetical protein
MGLGYAADLGETLDGPGFVRCSVHAILGAQQATQQDRVLQCAIVGRRG